MTAMRRTKGGRAMRRTLWMAMAAIWGAAAMAGAQAPSADELAALVEGRSAELEPYDALLNDPDPIRQGIAIEALLASGDALLAGMALEAGLGAADPGVRQRTLGAYLASGPAISIVIEGDVEATNYRGSMTVAGAAMAPDGTAAATYGVGGWDAVQLCYVGVPPREGDCLLRVGNGGVQVYGADGSFTFQGTLGADGVLAGSASVRNVGPGFDAMMRVLP